TYENNDPVRSSPPRIQINPVAATPRNHHTNQKASAFFSSLLEHFRDSEKHGNARGCASRAVNARARDMARAGSARW
ncbi:hypothetical protein, partial [Bosea sp. LC85]|uniref:hypothetical protein n=1 Tax=Bosea sp. LC85 TaxID=1502851 RepID=UPI001AEC35B1